MGKVSQAIHNLAQRLYDFETRKLKDPDCPFKGVGHVCEKFRISLQELAGNTGYLALLCRAVVLARKEHDLLKDVQLKRSEIIEFEFETDNSVAVADKVVLSEAGVFLLSQLLGLLAAFIGESLMMVLVRDIWPDDVLIQTTPNVEVES